MSGCNCAPGCGAGGFPQLTGDEYARTVLGGCVIGAVDCARNVATLIGARPYQVRLVWTRWTGGERGTGQEEVLRVCPITPTPLVVGIKNMDQTIKNVGELEEGDVTVVEISARYTEEELRGQSPNGESTPADQNFYWEIVFPRVGVAPLYRRFSLAGAPEYDAAEEDAIQWKVGLTKSNENRERNGDAAQ